jgi:hypothetical protein
MMFRKSIDAFYSISPADHSAKVSLRIFAAYEFERMLGRGELMHEAELTVGELLRHSKRFLRKFAAGLCLMPSIKRNNP